MQWLNLEIYLLGPQTTQEKASNLLRSKAAFKHDKLQVFICNPVLKSRQELPDEEKAKSPQAFPILLATATSRHRHHNSIILNQDCSLVVWQIKVRNLNVISHPCLLYRHKNSGGVGMVTFQMHGTSVIEVYISWEKQFDSMSERHLPWQP